ncbi:MAG: CPBP family intramembrane metalloprotease [Treponema sp.]|jgi:membrane protease YdiL (CAAX protease family)|nr:CPBP family intramembrane metalloprotease [Treponema sp.]
MRKINKACLFLIFTFVLSYSMAAIFYLIRTDNNNQVVFTLMAMVYMFFPFISVIIVKTIHKERIFSDLSISFKINRWFLVAWLIFPLFTFCTLGVSILFPEITYSPEMTGYFSRIEDMMPPETIEGVKAQIGSIPTSVFILLTLVQALIAGITINAIAGFGEEIGWRGFLLKEFKEMHFFKAALIIGSVWGIWHAPLILMGHNYPQHPQIGILMMTVYCILLTPIIQYITIKSKSVISAAIAHGTHNAIAGIAILLISGGNDLNSGTTGLPGFITLLIFNAGIFIYDYYISKEKIMLNKINNYL